MGQFWPPPSRVICQKEQLRAFSTLVAYVGDQVRGLCPFSWEARSFCELL